MLIRSIFDAGAVSRTKLVSLLALLVLTCNFVILCVSPIQIVSASSTLPRDLAPGLHIETAYHSSNGTYPATQENYSANTPIASPYVAAPSFKFNTNATSVNTTSVSPATGDIQEPCTVGNVGQPETNCGTYFQSVYGHDHPQSGSGWESEDGQVSVSVSFAGSTPSSLGSGNWISGGISTLFETSVHSWDIGIELYTYMDNTGAIGIAWYVLGACEYLPTCAGQGYPDYKVYDYNNAPIVIDGRTPNYAKDTIDMWFYYCNTQTCLNYNNGNPLYIFDVRDLNIDPSFWTYADIPVPSEAINHSFGYGVYKSCPYVGTLACNPPYDDSYGYQIGITSDILPTSPNLLVKLSNPSHVIQATDYRVAHGGTIGNLVEQCGGNMCEDTTDAWWHDFWSWGGVWLHGLGSALNLTPVSVAPIDDLSASQANSQTFTVGVNYYNGIQEYWPLDEGSGSYTYDVVNGSAGNLLNSPTWLSGSNCLTGGGTTTFTANDCLQLTSANSQQVSFQEPTADGFGTNGARQLTAIAWFDATSVSANQKIFCIYSGASDAAFCLAIQNAHTYTELFLNGQSYNQNALGSVSANTWHQIAVTWSNSNSFYDVYLDGNYIGDVASPSGASVTSKTSAGSLGALSSCNCYYFNGKIDDAMVYTNALSSSQILQLYQAVMGQNYASTGSECVQVTNFNQLLTDSGTEKTWSLSTWVYDHPFYNGNLWNVLSDSPCSPEAVTWAYASGYMVPDNIVSW